MEQNYLIRKMFENRGYTDSYFYDINTPTYDLLKDIDNLVVELKDIHDNGSVIAVYPDFDADGVSAGSCGFAGLAELGFNVRLYIPDPSKGYGISADSIDSLMKLYPDTKAIITCDTGIACGEAADRCKNLGVKFFVTDHHKQKSVIDADIIVDPMRIDETYKHPFICGAFVMYQVLQRYADLYCNSFMQDQIRRLRVFAGIGTVSDTMPLLYENRQVVRDAIDICRLLYSDDGSSRVVNSITGCDVYRRAFWGLYEMLTVFEDVGVISGPDDIDEDFFGFYFAPSVNSVKRMGGDMNRAFGLFFGNNRKDNMQYLYDLNSQRKVAVAQAMNELSNTDQPFAPFVYISDARPGILGLIAQKLCNDNGPVFVVNEFVDENGRVCYHGSGRSPEWYPCLTKLSDKMFVGGHEGSFGCGFDSKETLQSVCDFLSVDVPAARNSLEVAEMKPDFVISTDLSKDTGIDIPLFEDFLDKIDNYGPFGRGFPRPVACFEFRNNDVVIPDKKTTGWEIMGKAKQHLKIHFANGFDVVCWNQAYLVNQSKIDTKHVVVGMLRYNEFNGVRSVIFDGTLLVER